MKLPFSHPRSSYEPKSVLELRGSPGPQKPATAVAEFLVPDHHHVLIDPHFEDWDSWMTQLGLQDDDDQDSPTLEIPQISQNISEFSPEFGLLSDFPVSFENWNVGLDYVDDLIHLAECFDTNSLQLGELILARLNERLSFPTGKPLERAAFYFKEALKSVLTTTRIKRRFFSAEIVQTIKAQNIFAGVSPIPMFSSFTANQAVLESLEGATHVHVVDFDTGFGSQWASFMKEMAELHNPAAPYLRISAVVADECEAESNLVRENLAQFARELNIRFEMDFIPVRSFEHLFFKAIRFTECEKVAVILSPAIFRRIGSGFLTDLPRASPTVVVHVDVDGKSGYPTSSYRQTVAKGLEFYAAIMESIETANFIGANGWEGMRKIESFILYPKMIEAVEGVGRGEVTAAREALAAAGLSPVGISQFAEFQAECLVRKVQVRGFHVVKRHGEMVLYWQDTAVGATSAWRY